MIEDSMLATLPQTTSHAGMSYIILRTAMWLLTQRVYVTGPACRKLKMRFQESVQEESSIVTLSFTSCRGVGTLTAAGRNWRLKTRVWTVIKKFFVNQKPLKTTVCLAACWPLLPLFQALRAEMFHSHCLPVHFAATDLSQDFTIEWRNDPGSLWPIHLQNTVESSAQWTLELWWPVSRSFLVDWSYSESQIFFRCASCTWMLLDIRPTLVAHWVKTSAHGCWHSWFSSGVDPSKPSYHWIQKTSRVP